VLEHADIPILTKELSSDMAAAGLYVNFGCLERCERPLKTTKMLLVMGKTVGSLGRVLNSVRMDGTVLMC